MNTRSLCIQKKVALVGGRRAGKSSLIHQLVNSRFAEESLSTVGIRVDRWETAVGDTSVELILWDLAGPDQLEAMPHFYLEGCDAAVLVVDVQQIANLNLPKTWSLLEATLPLAARKLILNKSDLATPEEMAALAYQHRDWTPGLVSARTGEGVTAFFHQLATELIGQ